MSWFESLQEPMSKYDNSLPYTYEARVIIVEGEDVYNSYFADTICGLVEYLQQNNIQTQDVKLYEVYQDQDHLIPTSMCTDDNNQWLRKPDICRSFQEHYKGHIAEGRCSFQDRNRRGIGP